MKATDLTKRVAEIERELAQQVHEAIETALEKVAEETGLVVHGVDIQLLEVTKVDDLAPRHKLVRCRIRVSLPEYLGD